MREKLINICTPRQWKTLSTSELKDEGYTVYGANGVIGYYSEYNHEVETVMVTCRGATCGTVNISKPYSYINGNAMCMDDLRRDIDVKYLYYALKNYDFKEVISGSAQPQITRQGLNNVFVEVADKSRQLEIVKVLSNVEETITRKQQQLAEYDQLIKSRFVEMFGDLNHSQSQLIDLVTKGSGLSYGIIVPGKNVQNGVPMLRPSDFNNGQLNLTNLYCVDDNIEKKYAKTRLLGEELLVQVIGQPGQLMLTDERCIGMNVTRNLAVVRFDKEKINKYYLKEYMLTHKAQNEMLGSSNQSTLNQLPLGNLKQLMIPVPNIDLQNIYGNFVKQVNKLKFNVQRSLDETQKLFDSLMQEYFG